MEKTSYGVLALALCCALNLHAREIFPTELVDVTYTRPDSVFGGRDGYWDENLRERAWIMREGNIWRMWYTGYSDSGRAPIRRLGLAVSRDGFTWRRYQDGPLLEDEWVEDPMVLHHDRRYYMVAEGRNDRAGLLESEDGISWVSRGRLDIRKTNGEPIEPGPFGTPTLFHSRGVWWLFYERNDAAVWLARSSDMNRWVNVSDDPVIDPGTCGFDTGLIALDQVIEHDGLFYAYLHAKQQSGETDARVWASYVAVSDNLIDWYKYADNPLSPADGNYGSPVLVHDGKRFRMYTTGEGVNVHFLREPSEDESRRRTRRGQRRR